MPLEKYKADLAELKARDRLRSLSGESGLDFSSNDYLALSRAPSIRRALEEALAEGIAIGSGGSRLLRGNHPAHEELESKAAAFFGAERTLYFTSGYAANFTILSALPKRGDLVIFDELLHASSREGIHSGLAKRCKVPHNDLEAFDDALRKWSAAGGKGQPWMAVESLYSMDGDFAPIAGLVELADRYDAMLVVDEAHATGVHGPLGRGLTAPYEGRENLIVVHTCGKALGATGGLVCASKTLIDYIINRGRPFIYTTAPSPLMALAVSEALSLLEREPERREALTRLIDFANSQLTAKTGFPGSGSQIIPVVLGPDGKALQVANFLQERGFDIRAARPPTVPEGTARLRIAITLNNDEAQVSQMLEVLVEALAESEAQAEVAL